MNKLLVIGASTLLLAGCAAGPYYDTYGYGPSYPSGPYYSEYYGAPAYYGPNVGIGYYYYDTDGRRHWRSRDDRDWRDRDWRDRRDDRPGWVDRGDRGDRGTGPALQMVDPRGFHGESGNEAGMGPRVGGGR